MQGLNLTKHNVTYMSRQEGSLEIATGLCYPSDKYLSKLVLRCHHPEYKLNREKKNNGTLDMENWLLKFQKCIVYKDKKH